MINQLDNSTMYYERVADELIRFDFSRDALLSATSRHLFPRTVETNPDEIVVMHSALVDGYLSTQSQDISVDEHDVLPHDMKTPFKSLNYELMDDHNHFASHAFEFEGIDLNVVDVTGYILEYLPDMSPQAVFKNNSPLSTYTRFCLGRRLKSCRITIRTSHATTLSTYTGISGGKGSTRWWKWPKKESGIQTAQSRRRPPTRLSSSS